MKEFNLETMTLQEKIEHYAGFAFRERHGVWKYGDLYTKENECGLLVEGRKPGFRDISLKPEAPLWVVDAYENWYQLLEQAEEHGQALWQTK